MMKIYNLYPLLCVNNYVMYYLDFYLSDKIFLKKVLQPKNLAKILARFF